MSAKMPPGPHATEASMLAQRLVGASIPDFHGACLQERLRHAGRSLG